MTTSFYVDPPRVHRRLFRSGEWCHLATDGELDALHAFARSIGVPRLAFHPHAVHPHYDLTPERRASAVAAGAIEVSSKELVKRCFKR
jgi:hypothetical protein